MEVRQSVCTTTVPSSSPFFVDGTSFETPHELGGDVMPERKLWACVIAQFITDYGVVLRSISYENKKKGAANKHHYYSLQGLRSELDHPYFEFICHHIDIDISHVRRHLRKLESEFGLSEAKYSRKSRIPSAPVSKRAYVTT